MKSKGGKWTYAGPLDSTYTDARWRQQTRKMPGLSGPVDDAFMEPFLFVRPSGRPLHPEVGAWTQRLPREAPIRFPLAGKLPFPSSLKTLPAPGRFHP